MGSGSFRLKQQEAVRRSICGSRRRIL